MTKNQDAENKWLRAVRLPLLLLVLLLGGAEAQAASQPDSSRVYTEEHPLVYEDAWDLWPYVFLTDNGDPVGYNIDLLRLIFNELKIPYKIKLKPTKDALNDLKAGTSDLMLGMDDKYHRGYARLGKTVVQIFTHSVLHGKSDPSYVKSIDDLAKQRVIVHEGSFSHYFMKNRGWEDQAILYGDMQAAIQYVHNVQDNQIVWNTLSLKWLLHRYQYDELVLTPVNVPHGEYKFMSNDTVLLHRMDSVLSSLNATGRLQPIQNKWFYPEHKDTGIPSWVWYIVAALLVIIFTILLYYMSYRLYEQKMTKNLRVTNKRLSLILNTSKVHIWLFDIAKKHITSLDPDGKKTIIAVSPHVLGYYILPEDYEQLCVVLDDIAAQRKQQQTMELRTIMGNSKDVFTFSADFSVFSRDKNGHPQVIIAATTNVTEDRLRQQQQQDTMLRYRHIFNSSIVDTIFYDEDGYIDDMNEKAASAIPGGLQSVLNAHVSLQNVLEIPGITVDNLEYTYLTQIYKSADDPRALNRFLGRDELYYELQLVPVRDDDGKLLGIYGTGRNVTETAKTYSRLQKNIAQLQAATDELQRYMRNIDYVMKNGGVRIVNYSLDTHTLDIYSEIEHVQQQLTQTRLLSLVDEMSKKTAQRSLNSMDNMTHHPVKAAIKTTLRTKGNKRLCLYFSFVPVFDADGHVTGYFGMCRDISDIKATEEELERETLKAQTVETVKNAFLRNMSYEIRTPLASVVGFAELFEKEHTADDEQYFIREIKENSRNLLNLVNNILFLSRLDAGMIEYKPKPVDFVAFFQGRCHQIWANSQVTGVSYQVDAPYERLVLNVDDANLGIVIDKILTNAVQNTKEGFVRARCDYNGEDLTVAVQDTGSGIPADHLDDIFERFGGSGNHGSGLGLAISQEVVKQMGGRIRLKSEVGKGTVVWIIIPCTALEVQRKFSDG